MSERHNRLTSPEGFLVDAYSLMDDEKDEILKQAGIKANFRGIKIIKTTNGSGLANIARTLEAEQFKEAFDNSPEDMVDLYGEHEKASHFYMALTTTQSGGIKSAKAIGVLRAIEGGIGDSITSRTIPGDAILDEESFDLSKVFEGKTISPEKDKVWDIGTVAIDKEYRKSSGNGKKKAGLAGLSLYRALYWDMAREQVDFMTAMADYRLLKRLDGLGVPMKRFSGVKPEFGYKGSERTSAVIGYVPDFRREVLAHSVKQRKLASMAVFLVLLVGAVRRPEVYST